jgi:tetratricopeptide (TPR) repeat protein
MREERALRLLESCGNEPMFHPFYGVRAEVRMKMRAGDPEADLLHAVALAPDAWRAVLQLSGYYADQERWEQALEWARKGYSRHNDNYYSGLQLAKCYMYNEAWEEGIRLMKELRVLPNEGASEGRNVWRETNLHAAIDALVYKRYDLAEGYIDAARTWPENIGVGRPYDVDERLEDTLKYFCLMADGLVAAADLFKNRIVSYREKYPESPKGSCDLLSMVFLRERVSAAAFDGYREKWMAKENVSLPVRWCNALLDGDQQTLQVLSGEKVVPPVVLPYEIPFEDREFVLIKKMFNKGLLETGPVKFNI